MTSVYYWEADGLMTAAVRWKDRNFGLSFPIDDNVVRKNMDKRKLGNHLREVANALYLHGEDVLDSTGNISPKLLNDAEARRFAFDPLWRERVIKFNKELRMEEISLDKAKMLSLV